MPKEIADLAARGCRYLQMDDTNLAYLCDPEIRQNTLLIEAMTLTSWHIYIAVWLMMPLKSRPVRYAGISVHLCRGNFKSAWVAQGGYEPVAEILLNEMNIDGFFLEYDDERSGDFAPFTVSCPKINRLSSG